MKEWKDVSSCPRNIFFLGYVAEMVAKCIIINDILYIEVVKSDGKTKFLIELPIKNLTYWFPMPVFPK